MKLEDNAGKEKNNNSGISSNEKQQGVANYEFMSITQFKEID